MVITYPVVLAVGMAAAFKLGRGDKKADVIPALPVRKKVIPDVDARRKAQIISNMLNYDGSPASQKAVN